MHHATLYLNQRRVLFSTKPTCFILYSAFLISLLHRRLLLYNRCVFNVMIVESIRFALEMFFLNLVTEFFDFVRVVFLINIPHLHWKLVGKNTIYTAALPTTATSYGNCKCNFRQCSTPPPSSLSVKTIKSCNMHFTALLRLQYERSIYLKIIYLVYLFTYI